MSPLKDADNNNAGETQKTNLNGDTTLVSGFKWLPLPLKSKGLFWLLAGYDQCGGPTVLREQQVLGQAV